MNQVQLNYETPILGFHDTLTLDSREVAKMAEKRHDHLIRTIKEYIKILSENAKLRFQDFFIESSYKTQGNKKDYTCYLLTRKGCEFVANKMTGKKGILFTANYINRFHEMEQELLKQQAAKREKVDYSDMRYCLVPRSVRSFVDDAVKYTEEAEACLEVILGIIPTKDIAPVRCLVKEYGRIVHLHADSECRAVAEFGQDNYSRYCEESRKMRDYCARNVDIFAKEFKS